jgi:hypothetical protein
MKRVTDAFWTKFCKIFQRKELCADPFRREIVAMEQSLEMIVRELGEKMRKGKRS